MTTTTTPPTAGSSTPLPSRAHPTARALFEALDAQQRETTAESKSLKHETRQCSMRIRKQTQTLGWRNRYAQAIEYPVTLRVPRDVSERRIRNQDENAIKTNQQIEFTMQQVQRGEVEGTFGTGATVWPASMVLIKYLEHQQQKQCSIDKSCTSHVLLRNKSVVDLGAGTGVTSLAAALLGAKHVVCTDGCVPVVRLAQDNVARACTTLKMRAQQGEAVSCAPIQVQKYSWGDGTLAPQRFDIVLVADCVLPKLYPIEPLVLAIDELLNSQANPDSMALLSYEHRYYAEYDPKERFRELAARCELNVRVVPLNEQDPVYSVDDIEVWQVKRGQQHCQRTTCERP